MDFGRRLGTDPPGTVHRYAAPTVHAPVGARYPHFCEFWRKNVPVSHCPQTYAPDQRVGRHYRRFRGNVPLQTKGVAPSAQSQSGSIREVRLVVFLSKRQQLDYARRQAGRPTGVSRSSRAGSTRTRSKAPARQAGLDSGRAGDPRITPSKVACGPYVAADSAAVPRSRHWTIGR